MEVYGYVYMVRNKVNGKIYFGITENDFDTRYRHSDIKNTHNKHLKQSIEKYGIENFEINKEFDVAYNEDDLWDLEDMYICLYNTLDSKYGYNKRRSGSKRKGLGKMSEETKCKMSESKKGRKHTQEQKRKNSEGQKKLYKQGYVNPMKGKGYKMKGEKHHMYGKHHTEETKHKMREKAKCCKVVCLETQQTFITIGEAEKWCGGKHVGDCCKGKRKSTGKHPITGEKLHWMYYDEYLEQQNKDNSDSNNNKVA